MAGKKRLDQILWERGYFSSKTESQSSILAGNVFINDCLVEKPGHYYNEESIKNVRILKKKKYVSRGGDKLEKALKNFQVQLSHKICMDVGCSTGGFTDCLLKHGALKVYAIDVGYGQFDYNLRMHDKVALFERTNIRYLDHALIKDRIDVVTIDVSFISVIKFLNHIKTFCKQGYSIIILIKPQFESGRLEVVKGVVKSRKIHLKTLKNLFSGFYEMGLYVHDLTYSPLKGPKGNIEFLVHLKEEKKSFPDELIKQIVDEAHEKKS